MASEKCAQHLEDCKKEFKLGNFSKSLKLAIAAEGCANFRFPEASYNKGNCFFKLGDYQNALAAYTKAEKDSNDIKYPNASYNKGICFSELKEYQKAVESYTKAEEDSEDRRYPMASNNKGNCLDKLGKYDKALAAYIKAEEDSNDKKFPLASFNKGHCLGKLGEFEKAVAAFNKAEIDSDDGIYPEASFIKATCLDILGEYEKAVAAYAKVEEDSNDAKHPEASNKKGICLVKLGNFQKALLSFSRAEEDSEGGKYPEASFNKATCLDKLGEYEKAIVAYTKAEEDSKNGMYPKASNNKGLCLFKMGEYEKGIAAFTKAEEDSVNGKNPYASYNKGGCFYEINELKNAILCYTKAEDDSKNVKFPDASSQKGRSFFEMGDYKKAIVAYTKAEEDSVNGKNPYASYNKGICFGKIKNYPYASQSFEKAIKDILPDVNVLFHVGIANCLLAMGRTEEAKEHVFFAMEHDNRNYELIKLIEQKNSISKTRPIYRERKKYIEHTQILNAEYWYGKLDENSSLVKTTEVEEEFDPKAAFHNVLEDLEINLSYDINDIDRLRVSYLLYFYSGKYHRCFYLLDNAMEDMFGHSALEHYFYCLSAYLIGESVAEIKSILNNGPIETEWLGNKILELEERFKKAVDKDRFLDPYLLDINLPKNILEGVVMPNDIHPWVGKLLECIQLGLREYTAPISDAEIRGIEVTRLKDNYLNKYKPSNIRSQDWYELKQSLESIERGEKHAFRHAIAQIRKVIVAGVDYSFILVNLMLLHERLENKEFQSGINVLMAAVLSSNIIDLKKSPLNKKSIARKAVSGLAMEGFLIYVDVQFFGFGTALGILGGTLKTAYDKYEKNQESQVFNEYAYQIEHLYI